MSALSRVYWDSERSRSSSLTPSSESLGGVEDGSTSGSSVSHGSFEEGLADEQSLLGITITGFEEAMKVSSRATG